MKVRFSGCGGRVGARVRRRQIAVKLNRAGLDRTRDVKLNRAGLTVRAM